MTTPVFLWLCNLSKLGKYALDNISEEEILWASVPMEFQRQFLQIRDLF